MRVLVTGLDGFTGKYLRKELEDAHHEVFGLESDLLDSVSLQKEIERVKPEAVVHLAAIAFVGHGNSDDFYNVNLLGSKHLLEAISLGAPNINKVIMASSANVYGNTEGDISETNKLHPINDYAVSKLAMEYMSGVWLSRLPIVITRPFNYTGVGQSIDFLVPKIVSHFIEKKEIIELGNLDVSRDFSDVRSVVSAYRGLLENGTPGEIYNICSGIPIALRKVVEMCSEISGHSITVKVNQAFVRSNEVMKLFGNADKLKNTLPDWEMHQFHETLNWMLANNTSN